jgi:uncharacterized protein YbdZ (MbtH family)
MSWQSADREDTTIYKVVVNHENQYSIWPQYKENPLGWSDVGKVGLKDECLTFIKETWTDLRPLSLRRKMEEMANSPPPPVPNPEGPAEKSLVDRLSEGDHPVEAALRPDKSVKPLKEAIDRNYVHLRFTNTRGGTELGVKLNKDLCDFGGADFDAGRGRIHLEGTLTLNYVDVQCIADLDLETLAGHGHLVKIGKAVGS